jgi:hypothetical protein
MIKLPKNGTLELLALFKMGVNVKGGPEWNKILKVYNNLDKLEADRKMSDNFNGELLPYQKIGVT